MTAAEPAGVTRLLRIVLNSADPEALEGFFIDALGFAPAPGLAVGSRLVRLGATTIELRHATGQPYPREVPGWSPLFQHCALLTLDINRSLARLKSIGGFTAISIDGPQRLPAASGGVTAFKFRDPEGHPLEFIVGAPGPVRVDHSAISVRDTARSIAFYETLGLAVGQRTLNIGIEQQHLDAVADAEVEVTALQLPDRAAPHVELLCYRGNYDRKASLPDPEDIVATRLIFGIGASTSPPAGLRRDPDGHLLGFEISPAAQ